MPISNIRLQAFPAFLLADPRIPARFFPQLAMNYREARPARKASVDTQTTHGTK
jgi:hypothetical protein